MPAAQITALFRADTQDPHGYFERVPPPYRQIIDNIRMPPFEEETTRFLVAWMQVRQIIQASNFNRFQRAGLSATQFMTLNVLPKDGMTLSEIARRLNLSAATLNETVNSLVERGFAIRTPDPNDARKILISATKEGEDMQNSASKEFHAFMTSLFARMSKTRRDGLLSGLEELVKLSHADLDDTTRRSGVAPQGKRNSRQSPPR
jgi:DNA-binding MarR family transcriptional regulator